LRDSLSIGAIAREKLRCAASKPSSKPIAAWARFVSASR
jgi:hypothetical protein